MADNISRERKKELELPDPFQQNLLKALSFAKTFRKQLIILLALIVVTTLVFSGIIVSFKKAEDTAGQLVAEAMNKYTNTNDPEKGFIEAEKDFKFIFKEYANTNASRYGKIQFAKICYDASQLEQSYQCYKEALNEFKNSPLFKNFLLSSIAHVCIARQKLNEAKEYFLQIESSRSKLLKDNARFNLAMLSEIAGSTDESKKMYESIVKEHTKSLYLPIAEEKIAVMN
jgi:predicted negative regulator of RcsB-dependent stress response